jgi:hypothetical protein
MEVAMYNRAAKPKPGNNQLNPDPLERGQFSDGRRVFVVRASSATAPDSFQVHTRGNQADPILIASGLNSGNLHATWNEEWRSASPEWREWARNNAFKAFHTLRASGTSGSSGTAASFTSGKFRFCCQC